MGDGSHRPYMCMLQKIVGVEGRDQLARPHARAAGGGYGSLAVSTYRAGERAVRASPLGSARGRLPVSKRCLLVADVEADGESGWRGLLAADALRRAGARKVSLLAPWMAYGRQDKPAKTRESTGGVVLGAALSRAFDRIYTLEAHSPLFRKHFGGRLKSLSARDLAVTIARSKGAMAVAAPDHGAVKRAKSVAKRLRVTLIVFEKVRTRPGLGGVRTKIASGDPTGHRVVLVDDMVDSGGTLKEAAHALRSAGARSVGAIVTHAANPVSVPRAQDLGLGYMEVVYRRNGKPKKEIIEFLLDAV